MRHTIEATAATPIPPSLASFSKVGVNEIAHFKARKRGLQRLELYPPKFHPCPLVLVYGLNANGIYNWLYMASRFITEGYCVFAITYGQLNNIPIFRDLDKMENSAQRLKEYVDRGVGCDQFDKVDMLGHSQGSLMSRYYMEDFVGGAKVRKCPSGSLSW